VTGQTLTGRERFLELTFERKTRDVMSLTDWRRSIPAAVLLSVAALGGCSDDGKDEVEVSGRVTMDGEPVPQGTITFLSLDGSTPTGGGVITDGSYTAKVPVGAKKVTVLGNKIIGTEPSLKGVPDSAPRNKYQMVTPLEYNAASVTPLRADITGPQEGLDFALTKAEAEKVKKAARKG
jgi:hypothetical protein